MSGRELYTRPHVHRHASTSIFSSWYTIYTAKLSDDIHNSTVTIEHSDNLSNIRQILNPVDKIFNVLQDEGDGA